MLFAGIADDTLLGYGVPPEWLDEVRGANEDTLFDVADRLPQEAAEALLNLATGTTPAMPERAPIEADPFAHPDAQRRFRLMPNMEELERALDRPKDVELAIIAGRRIRDPLDRNGQVLEGDDGTDECAEGIECAIDLGFRQAHGPFHSVEELDAVPGIGPARIEQLKGLVLP